ncbi:gamma-glutamylcyclotransferase family protein [Cohnella soli]|uniref:Gamma-glutamylcyclotransferase n=1 Tax=Cohnella soli TaxID=425005 RepID=A0ABW0HNX9_9BACL
MKTTQKVNVFVYGTLQSGERNHRVIHGHILDTVSGKVSGKLYDVGSYPAAVLGSEGVIEGEWLLIDEAGLVGTDRLEGYTGPDDRNYYDRVWVTDLNGGTEGWIYVWSDSKNLPEIRNGSWKNRNAAAS